MAAEAPRDLTGSQYLRSSAAKKLQLSPANSASYAGYRKATRKGKKSKQRFEVKPGNLPRNLLCSLIGRNKERFRHHQEPARTSGRKKVCRIPRWDATCDYVLCRLSCSPEKTDPVEPLRPLRHLYSMDNSIQETQNLPSWTNVHKIFVSGTSIHRTFALVPRVSPE